MKDPKTSINQGIKRIIKLVQKKKILVFCITVFILLLLVPSKKEQDRPEYISSTNMSIDNSSQNRGDKTGTSGLIETITGESVVSKNGFDLDAYNQISYYDFVQYIKDHYAQKRKTDFKGVSIFQESYRFTLNLPYKPVPMSAGMKNLLVNAIGDEQIADAFSHIVTINIEGINFYYFIQEKLALDILNNWSKSSSYELFVFIPFTNHFDEYVPILVNATSEPIDTSVLKQDVVKTEIPNPNEKTYCYVDKNGSFEMTTQECQELANTMGDEFKWKAFQYCLAGKNPEVGDSGTKEDREQACMNMFGYTKNE